MANNLVLCLVISCLLMKCLNPVQHIFLLTDNLGMFCCWLNIYGQRFLQENLKRKHMKSKRGNLILMPVERRCGKCWRLLRPEEDFCSECGVNCVAMPLPIKINEDGTFEAKIKFISRNKISKQGKEAKEHLRIDIPHNRKMHTVVEKDSEGNWQLVHDEDIIQEKKKQQSKESHDK